MKMDKVAGSQNDEFYTPLYAIEPIIKYVKKQYQFGIYPLQEQETTIWCPFDNENSLFVKEFTQKGFNVKYSHIENGEDFFQLSDIPTCDYIISNPPYSRKTEVFEKLFKLGIPFAMLVGVVGLFESKRRFEMFKNNEFEIMYMNKRIAYFKNYGEQKPSLNPPFSSVYITQNMLPEKIVFETINKR